MPVLPAEDCPLEHAHGRVLRSPIIADRDFPPFDRVAMDGYAMRLGGKTDAAFQGAFRVIGLQAAGMIPLAVRADDECVEISTGAVLPSGADTIVPCEEVERDGDCVRITAARPPMAGQFVQRRGSDYKQGDAMGGAGVRAGGREIAAAAACGCATLRVSMLPRIAIVTTGDELVEISNPSPAAHQMRRSNDHALRAELLKAGYPHVECMHVRDVGHEIEARVKRIIAEHDVVLTTGGVSKGRLDLLPGVFEKLGVVKKVQGVAQRPGKALWFGVSPRGTAVFALPGNPVSSYVCFHRYVLPALAHMGKAVSPRAQSVRLAGTFALAPALTHFVPVRFEEAGAGERLARAMPNNISGDLAALLDTDGFVEVPPGGFGAGRGDVLQFYPWS